MGSAARQQHRKRISQSFARLWSGRQGGNDGSSTTSPINRIVFQMTWAHGRYVYRFRGGHSVHGLLHGMQCQEQGNLSRLKKGEEAPNQRERVVEARVDVT